MPNSPLKILHILDHSLPLHSGYAFRSQSILRAQHQRSWKPLALTSPKHEQSWKGEGKTVEPIGDFRYYRTGPLSREDGGPLEELRLMMTLGRRIHEVVCMERPDLLHAHSPILTGLPALWIGRKLGLPVVYEIRAFWEDAAVDHGTYGKKSWKYQLVKALETWVCRRVDEVVVLCRGLRNDLIKRGIAPHKLTIVFNGIHPEDFTADEPDAELRKAWKLTGKKVVGFIGSFYRYEGLDLLVNAMARLTATRPDVVLLLVGDGEMAPALKAQIERLQLMGQILMPGSIPHDRVPAMYTLIDVLAYPRRSMRLTELVTPLKPLEAMAMGKALVASDVGGHRELIQHGHTGLLFPADHVSPLVDALQCLLDNDALRHNLQRQGFSWVRQHHSWEKTTAVYSDVYARALHKSALRRRCRPRQGAVLQLRRDRRG